MNSKITQEDILLYLYNETSPKRSKEILDYINKYRASKLFYLETKDLLKKLDEHKEMPSATSLNIVMENASKSNSLEETL